MKLSKKSLLSQKYTEEFVYFCCHAPQGVRGLKYKKTKEQSKAKASHPVRGAWIEMVDTPTRCMFRPSHPARGAWIEMFNLFHS